MEYKKTILNFSNIVVNFIGGGEPHRTPVQKPPLFMARFFVWVTGAVFFASIKGRIFAHPTFYN